MALPIRQGATHKVAIGPVVAVGDGFTPITTLDVSTSDEAEVILHDNGTVVDISGYTFAAIATADGWYHLTLQSGISNTVGHMTVVINDDSLCLPLAKDFVVLDTGIYDSLYADAAVGLATTADLLDKVGAVDEAAATGDPSATESVMQYVKQLVNVLVGSDGIASWPASSAPGDGISLSEALRATYDDTNSLDGTKVPDTLSLANINTEVDTAFTTQMADSVSADGSIATREQALYMVLQVLTEFAISGTTLTVKKVNGSTTLFVETLDDATNPTSITRS